jgi:lycopene beta-cyclase
LTSTKYNIIIIGAGCSGLSLLVRLIESGKFADKKILLLDREFKNKNDRTWCFWEKGKGYFETIVHHQWPNLQVKHPSGEIDLEAAPYQYKMVRGIDFYKHCFGVIKEASNVVVRYDEVTAIDTKGLVTCGEQQFSGDYIFTSVLLQPPVLKEKQFYLLQHFKGWWIETPEDVFDETTAHLMNFNVSQQHGCTFVYVLPVNARRALIEYTLFSEEELAETEYEQGLQTFIQNELKLINYTITEKEQGVIPMTNLNFPKQDENLFYIGTAGGQTKASSGYTFQFIQKQSTAIVEKLIQNKEPLVTVSSKRFHFYDSVLLRVLHERKLAGANVFYQMFQRNKADKVFKFLDNESTLVEELRIMNSTDKSVFIPAAMKEMR